MLHSDRDRLVLTTELDQVGGGEDDVEGLVGIEREGLLHVAVGLVEIVLRVPVDGQVAIGHRQRILLDRLVEHGDAAAELAAVDGHLAETVERDRARQAVGRPLEDRLEDLGRADPVAGPMAMGLSEDPIATTSPGSSAWASS